MSNPSFSSPLVNVDIMNDPAYAPQKSSMDGANEPDHCRICRSEGTVEEQLFHPCKCSGSIKFVHQDCLMEWLQHSQKKYCELCKTPFQFTKLYDPEMPKNLPPLLFLSRASKHIAKTILLWLRLVLVCFVWLGILPWVVRWMWRFWFWLGDGGWAWWRRRPYFVESPLPKNATFAEDINNDLGGNQTTDSLEGGGLSDLGNGGLFVNITRSETLNKIFLDTFEGQILTALIVVTFVMIFLIREWVVQQQPDIALGGDAGGIGNLADLDQAPGEPAVDIAEEDQGGDEEEDGLPDEQLLDSAFGRVHPPGPESETDPSDEEQPAVQQQVAPFERPIAPLRRRRAFPPVEENHPPALGVGTGSIFGGQGRVLGGGTSTAPSTFQLDSDNPRRPQAKREVMAQDTEFRRQIEERFGPDYLEKFAASSATIPQIRASIMNNIIDDDSDWEDEEEQGAENKHGGSHRHGKSTTPLDTPNREPFQSRSTASASPVGNIFEEDKPNPNSSTWAKKPEQKPPTIVFGASQGTNSFGDWEISQPASGKPFQFSGSKSTLTKGQIFAQSSGEQDVQTPSTIDTADKGKGKANVPLAEGNGGVTIGELNAFGIDTFTNVNNEHKQTALEFQPEKPRNALHETTDPLEYESKWSSREPPLLYEGSEQDEHYRDYLSEGYESNDPLPQEAVEPAAPNENDRVPAEPGAAARALVRPAGARGIGWLDWFLVDIPQVDRNAGNNRNEDAAAPPADEAGIADMGDDRDAVWNVAVNPPRPEGAQNNLENGVNGAAAPLDIDEGDDFDGIMELIGMRGPIFGLLQNAVISLVLITIAVMLGVAVPYIWGRILLTVLAHPLLFAVVIPWSLAVFCANLMIDTAIGVACYTLFVVDTGLRFILTMGWWSKVVNFSHSEALGTLMHTYAADAWKRVVHKITTLVLVLASDRTSMEGVSIIATHPETSHAWLASRQPWARATLAMSWFTEKFAASVNLTSNASHSLQIAAQENKTASEVFYTAFAHLVELWKEPSIKQRNATIIIPAVSEAEEALVEFSNSSSWTAADRVVAVIAGYVLFTIVGAWYLAKHRSQPGSYRRHLEKTSIELLQQAGGVMKVILIIGIEMFVFPLYCGLLLDVALLPLFENATIISRIQFTNDHVFTSTFVHWFVGTCYMFHFALFVSMCRKIMRAGVLYFIRDPDDPTLHPVKDVLERPVMLQLRKIAFSALIYGFLVLVCLGGVVWFIFHQFESVLPIHWSSNEPVLEFPVDLLFYNFFMPVAVQFFKPSEGLQKMYTWWFKKCARALRLTSFMFGDRHEDEEGHTVRKTWLATLLFKGSDATKPVTDPATADVEEQDTYFLRDGRFVRAPASDSVRRPKGQAVFIPVTEDNRRQDGEPDPEDGETGPNSTNFRLVYIPPHFRMRIFLVVFSIWLFAAVTGVGITIGPLLLGRTLLRTLVPKNLRMNDIYAFSVGIYIIGGIVYAITTYQAVIDWFNGARMSWRNPSEAQKVIRNNIMRAVKISYVFVAFALVLPTLLALIIEFYIIIPMHTYFSQGETHVIHFIQDWTLGVLYVKMMGSMMLLDPDSPWARALRGVVARGYLDPDVKLATRCFILPATLFMSTALLLPLGFAFAATKTFLHDASPKLISQTYRYSYPAVFILIVFLGVGYFFKMLMDKWKQSVRDEVYLIGERLHNHGERRPPTQGHSIGVQTDEHRLEPGLRRRGIERGLEEI
ncbi:hypothetical protein BGX38DRAFT_1267228 [Terfezia claveryi]|nr:hypothetical protein BGX38DRAFT_1267228 [Terfezia claveryi]